MNWVLAFFVGCWLYQISYWLFFFVRLKKDSTTSPNTPSSAISKPPISVIICAKNEATNLLKNLPTILEQSYPNFEVLVVNDRSDDNSAEILLQLQQQYPYLNVLEISTSDEVTKGKKFALSKGIQAAQHDLLLLTDADCKPISNQWISTMNATIQLNKAEIVLGYGPINQYNSFLNDFIRYETTFTAMQYFSFALAGLPYMGVGRNLMYYKSVFTNHSGFENHKHIASGDDDLFVGQVSNMNNTAICLDEKSFMYSEPKMTFKSFYRQKTRHLSTSTLYKPLHIILLGGMSFTLSFLYLSFFIIIVIGGFIKFAISLMLIRCILMLIINSRIYNLLKVQDLLLKTLLLDCCHALYLIIMSQGMLRIKKDKWT